MFPNNIDFFVREKEAERRADIEHIRLTRRLKSQPYFMRYQLGRILHGLGNQLVSWGDKLQVRPPAMAAKPSERKLT